MPKPKSESEVDTRTQRQKFIDAGKEFGADGTEEDFRYVVRGIAKPPAKKTEKAPKAKS